MLDSFVQWTLSEALKLDHCLTSSSRMPCSLSRQSFFSWATAESWKVTPPCWAMPVQTCSTLRVGTLSTTGIMSCAPSARILGRIIVVLRTTAASTIARPPCRSRRPRAAVPEKPLTSPDSDRYGCAPGLGDLHESGCAFRHGAYRRGGHRPRRLKRAAHAHRAAKGCSHSPAGALGDRMHHPRRR